MRRGGRRTDVIADTQKSSKSTRTILAHKIVINGTIKMMRAFVNYEPVGAAKRMKQFSLATARAAGIFSITKASSWRKRRLLILAYHGISLSDEHRWDSNLFLTPERFRRRMEQLRRGGYCVLPLEEGLRRAASDDLPPASVAITFDDGFYNFYKAALPILESFGFPATLYLTTFYSDVQLPVFDSAMSYILWKAGRAAEAPQMRKRAQEQGLSAKAKHEILHRLASETGFDFDTLCRERIFHLMKPDEAAECARRGADIQLHTHRHRTPMDRDKFMREIDDNRQRLEEISGKPARHFCYPSGTHRADFFPWLRERGVLSATTCEPGFTSRETDPMRTPRLVDVTGLNDVEFEGWLCGVSARLPRRALLR